MANSVDLDEVAYNKLPHQDICCLQFHLFSSSFVNVVLTFFTPQPNEEVNRFEKKGS